MQFLLMVLVPIAIASLIALGIFAYYGGFPSFALATLLIIVIMTIFYFIAWRSMLQLKKVARAQTVDRVIGEVTSSKPKGENEE
jgi:hypothetical protein